MIRSPTPESYDLYWYHQAIAGKQPTIYENEPHSGWYKRRFVKDGPWVPARIWLEQIIDEDGLLIEPECYRCEVNGEEKNVFDEWIWLCANPIPKREWLYLEAQRRWAMFHSPDDPAANPRRKIDRLTLPVRF